MNIVNTLPYASSSSSSPRFSFAKLDKHSRPKLSFSTPKRRRSGSYRRRPTKSNNYTNNHSLGSLISISSTPEQDANLSLVLDVNQISNRFNWLVDYSRDACSDLQNLITLDEDRRIVVSCRRSTVEFVGGVVVVCFVLGFAFRVLVKLGSAFRGKFENKPKLVVRRDRSLGGKEVVVAVDSRYRGTSRGSGISISSDRFSGTDAGLNRFRFKVHPKLPKWWPVSSPVQSWVSDKDKDEYQRQANRLIRVIMDNRTSGKDIMEEDIIQLRRVCRTAGIRVSIDLTNTRDTLYRASIEFVLNVCSRAPWESTSVDIGGEGAREFVAGLAKNIGLEDLDAARMVSAAVAARTRSWFLQAWALEIQGRHSESRSELSKICLVHRVFPPDESSPEMEMVARGLEKLMKVEEREFLLKTFVQICGEGSRRTAAEALGLMLPTDAHIGDHKA